MRLLLYLFYYVLALGMGFVLRQRYDNWMWSKPHQQQRLRTFCEQVAADPDPDPAVFYVPPPTTDNFALFPAPSDGNARPRVDQGDRGRTEHDRRPRRRDGGPGS